jgi:predicted AAA+ superfamily ATPase
LLVPPYFENFGKRLIKSPKVYWCDSGMACHLLGIDSEAALRRSPFAGAIFETFVASELAKAQINRGRRRDVYYFRDQRGLEVDFLVPGRDGALWLIEAKATSTVVPKAADSLVALRESAGATKVRAFVVHAAASNPVGGRALRPGVSMVTVRDLATEIES